MKDFLDILMRINFWAVAKTESRSKEQRTILSKIILNGIKYVVARLTYVYLCLKHKMGLVKVNPLIDDDKPIVSLTSFPLRVPNLWMVIYCMFRQTSLPGKIVVTFTNEEMPGEFDSLPDSLKYFSDKGVEYLFVNDNLKPHNKYYYSRQKYSDRIIITIDDDLLYYRDTVERLMALHKLHPDAVCTDRSHLMTLSGGTIDSYSKYRDEYNMGPCHSLIALGSGGVLYPSTFYHHDLYDIEKIKRLSLSTDDLWLKVMEIMSGTKVVSGSYYAIPITIPSSQGMALMTINTGQESRNDKNLSLLEKEYEFTKILLQENE